MHDQSEQDTANERLRRLPSVERLASALEGRPHGLSVLAARDELILVRERILAGGDVTNEAELLERAGRRAESLQRGSLQPVINATGVVLNTNLGRAPLAPEAALHAAAIASGYSNLEYDLGQGQRGSRQSHVEDLLRHLSGAEAAIAVNNNAAAILLVLTALANGRDVIVSRGELVEIGDSFRIPEILAQSGASLVEVGTTNRTRLADYEVAITQETAMLLRVHQSNFRTVGFTESVPLAELATLADERGLTLVDDFGSGALHPIEDEPLLRESIRAGADVVCCSADKLLGGPQAGIIAGDQAVVESCARHPLARALRLDKLQLAALEATLRLHRDEGAAAVPALAMLDADPAALQARAEVIAAEVGEAAEVRADIARAGGGSLPLAEFEGPVCAVDAGPAGAEDLVDRLRNGDPPVVARIADDRVLLDPRAMSQDEARVAGSAVRHALG